jgi:hypothetical protein
MTTDLRLYLAAALATVYVAVFWALRVQVPDPPAPPAAPAVQPAPAPRRVVTRPVVRVRPHRVRTRSS